MDLEVDRARTEIGWLRVLKPASYELGLPVANLILNITIVASSGAPARRLKLLIPSNVFKGWFQFAVAFAAASGVADQDMQREITLCWGKIDQEREHFPMFDNEIREIGGEVERYDVRDLPKKPMPRSKKECRVLPTTQNESVTIYIKQKVLREIEEAAGASAEREIGGLLVGDACPLHSSGKTLISNDCKSICGVRSI